MGCVAEFDVRLSTVDGVKCFVNRLGKVDCTADLVSGRYVIDAKSIMGIFSLDLTKKLRMKVHTGDVDEVRQAIGEFIV